MNLNISGHHLEITPAIREYVASKFDRVVRHHEGVIGASVIMSVDKLNHKVEANVHLSGKDIHVEVIEPDMYAAVDVLVDKLDRQILKHKEKRVDARHEGGMRHAIHEEGAAAAE